MIFSVRFWLNGTKQYSSLIFTEILLATQQDSLLTKYTSPQSKQAPYVCSFVDQVTKDILLIREVIIGKTVNIFFARRKDKRYSYIDVQFCKTRTSFPKYHRHIKKLLISIYCFQIWRGLVWFLCLMAYLPL